MGRPESSSHNLPEVRVGDVRWLMPLDVIKDEAVLVLVVGISEGLITVTPVHQEPAFSCHRDFHLFPSDLDSADELVVMSSIYEGLNPSFLSSRTVNRVRDDSLIRSIVDLACTDLDSHEFLKSSQGWRCGPPLPSHYPPFHPEVTNDQLLAYWGADSRYTFILALLSQIEQILDEYSMHELFMAIVNSNFSPSERVLISSVVGTQLKEDFEKTICNRNAEALLKNRDELFKICGELV